MALNQIDNSGDATLRLAQLFFVEYAAAYRGFQNSVFWRSREKIM
jgi:hypothetical protein